MLDPFRPTDGTATGPEAAIVILREMPSPTMINLRGPVDDQAFAGICRDVLGISLPATANLFTRAKGLSCLWQAPDEWLIIDTGDKTNDLIRRLDDALADFHHAVTDVSGNRVVLRLSGGGALELLSAGCSLDLGAPRSREEMTFQTIVARTPVTIQCIDDAPTFDLLVRRSFARYLQQWLETVAELAGLSS